MAFTKTIQALIMDEGKATEEFLAFKPKDWAKDQMAERYGHLLKDTDGANSIPYLCFEHLKREYRALLTWFNPNNEFVPTLQSAFMAQRVSGPLGDGIGWDFKPNGDPCQEMLIFKNTLMSVWRAAEAVPPQQRVSGNPRFGGMATLIRSAYEERAKLHRWTPCRDPKWAILTGADISARWVAHSTFVFLLQLGVDKRFAWEAARCQKLYGPYDSQEVL